MAIIDDPDFLSSRAKQLAAVQELTHLCARLVDLQSELMSRMQEQRQIIGQLTDQDLVRQREVGRVSRAAAVQRARASDTARALDQSVAALRDEIRRLEFDIVRESHSIEVAIANVLERSIALMSRRDDA